MTQKKRNPFFQPGILRFRAKQIASYAKTVFRWSICFQKQNSSKTQRTSASIGDSKRMSVASQKRIAPQKNVNYETMHSSHSVRKTTTKLQRQQYPQAEPYLWIVDYIADTTKWKKRIVSRPASQKAYLWDERICIKSRMRRQIERPIANRHARQDADKRYSSISAEARKECCLLLNVHQVGPNQCQRQASPNQYRQGFENDLLKAVAASQRMLVQTAKHKRETQRQSARSFGTPERGLK